MCTTTERDRARLRALSDFATARMRQRRRLGLLVLGSALFLGCRTESAPRATGAAADAAAVESTLVRFSSALATADTGALRALASPTFVLLDEGRAYDLDATFASIQGVLATARMTRVPRDVRVQQRGDVAWASYRIQGDFRTDSQTVPLRMLEAAVLERTGSGWRIAQMATLAER